MKLHKFISRTVLATALLGATFGGLFSLTNVSAGADDNPTGYISNPGSGASNGTKSNLQVNDGLLTLDNVPTLTFGSGKSQNNSNILKLDSYDNHGDQNDKSRLLEVTDYRNGSKNIGSSNSTNDWTLTANMDPVQTNGVTNNQQVNQKWEIDLFNRNSGLATNKDSNSNNMPNVQNSTLVSGGGNGNVNNNSHQNQSTVMSKGQNSGNSGYGVNQINYTDENAAQLVTPNVAPGSYTTNINWNLSTNVNSGSNGGSSTPSK